ncbi:MAG: hypothetical protein A3F82_07195 [Deltaproteobacteria bacterium RIFCSPLOWO2_12_FULL_44_12]|nr:MAG: hypothetical protein A2712_10030 [Deltaproteobacteria bacterium RIFCSPHIGHO2_01_FULL_43_49]OGQ15448.1 MAG: hypothetical protein A3D22_10560 [Deltaproteobacteria bacterium RIFCSPHIGHO2_02_FULL_44_53]OGQ29641.1 MAG: hypothetical protein A3D98_10760 [Deltaproteobacteria bacterium RIFCSPHIGHO2_12_FULL_44_21]OGQ32254.1 MAG: hypothetical protein A2979_00405 [Deltaproteobacteria bacterium RIFCSPLOWO2_01_FULL_45_74]OGQ43897.1 MAG: hypothetical protein A3I70_04305 [Deltaproteobacteria bacterium 
MAKEPLEIFHRLSRVITQAASLAEVYDIILDEIVNTMGVERASIMRYDPKSRMLKIVAARGIEPEVWKSVEIPVGEGQSGRVFQEGKSILIKNLKGSPRYKTHSFMISPVTSFPMKMGQVPVGVINLTDKKSGEPFTQEDLKLLSTLSNQVASYMHLCDLAEQLKSAEQAQLELEVARDIQQRLLPQKPPKIEGVELAGQLIPASRVGADYYDFLVLPENCLALAIADVSGHSVGGALLASAFRSCLKLEIQKRESPAKIVQAINQVLFSDLLQSEQFISFFYASYQLKTKTLLFTNAGQNPPLLWRAKKKTAEWLMTQDSLLGIEENLNFHEKTCQLESEDMLILYTDGLTEAASPEGRRFGSKRLLEVAQECASMSAQAALDYLLKSWRHFIHTDAGQDDTTLVVLKVK